MVNGKTHWDLSVEGMQAWGKHAKTPVCFHQLDQLEDQQNLLLLTPGERLAHRKVSLHPAADALLHRIGAPLLSQHLKRFYTNESPALFHILSSGYETVHYMVE